jgi:transcriptional regulator with XRE-family HTH domain
MKSRSRHPVSRFGRFMNMNGITTMQLAEISGVSRQHIYRLRYDRMEPTRTTMLDLRTAMSAILCRRVYVSEIFAIGEDDVLGAIAFLSDAMLRVERKPARERSR